jgi:CubicO group peptidase (beta-lactamase class C family)
MEGPIWEASQHGAAGLYSTAADMLSFGQMILNGGSYGDVRILGRATVEAMTSNRLPGISAKFGARLKREAGYGYGWVVRNFEAYAYFGGGLLPIGSLSHPGAGGVGFWIDKQHEVVGFCTEFATDLSDDLEPRSWLEHRFEDVVVSALADID